jgi:translation initiation factor IF-2
MLKKFIEVLKQAFWIKPRSKKSKRKTAAKPKRPKAAKKVVAQKKKAILKTVASKKVSQKPTKKPPQKLPDPASGLLLLGEITHYFDRIKVCVVKITGGSILIGDRLTVIGSQKPFVQKVWSMQIESEDVKVAKKGQLVGIKVDKPVQPGDKVYK